MALAVGPAIAPAAAAEAAQAKAKKKKCKAKGKGKGKRKGGAKSAGKGKKKGKARCKKAKKKKGKDTGGITGPATPASPPSAPQEKLNEVIFVGNNWEGTADVIKVTRRGNAHPQYESVARLNIIPDHSERMAEILTDPVRLGYFLGIRMVVGEGNDQFVDDMYSSNDGRLLIVSRPSFRDVIGMKIATGEIDWRFVVDGQRSDHMALSPDGRHVAVSASTGNVVHILDVVTGKEVGRFPSGDSPHENTYSEDGERIYHASIGLVYTPFDHPLLDSTKGDRRFQIVDTATNEIKLVDIGQKAADAGYPDMSSAVRPMAISSDESRIYMQVSFHHGFLEYDNLENRVLRVANLPDYYKLPRETYLLDSAHHGIAIDGEDDDLCVAGTMSDYAAIVDVDVDDFSEYTLLRGLGTKPYWSTTSPDGEYCYVSWSGTDAISIIHYDSREEIARIPVGDHPQRVRSGVVTDEWLAAQGG